MKKPVERVVVCCKHCQKYFSVPHWEPKQGKGKYCSASCRSRGVNTSSSETVTVLCQQCGAAFPRKAWQLAREGRGKYCSAPCANTARRKDANAPDRQYPDRKPKPKPAQRPAPVSPRVDDLPLTDGSGYVPCARCRQPRLRGTFCTTCEYRAAEMLAS